MALNKSLILGKTSELSLLRRHVSEDVFGVQIAGCNAFQMGQLSEIIKNEFEIDFLDINMGCPLDQVCNLGCGSGISPFYLHFFFFSGLSIFLILFLLAMMTKVNRIKETVLNMASKFLCQLLECFLYIFQYRPYFNLYY